jgi:hypothetical protein
MGKLGEIAKSTLVAINGVNDLKSQDKGDILANCEP